MPNYSNILTVLHFAVPTTQVEPLASTDRANAELKKKEEEVMQLKEDNANVTKFKMELEEQNASLLQQNNDLLLQVRAKENTVSELEGKIERLVVQKANSDQLIQGLEAKSVQIAGAIAQMEVEKRMLKEDGESQKKKNEDLESKLARTEQQNQQIVADIQREKKSVENHKI